MKYKLAALLRRLAFKLDGQCVSNVHLLTMHELKCAKDEIIRQIRIKMIKWDNNK